MEKVTIYFGLAALGVMVLGAAYWVLSWLRSLIDPEYRWYRRALLIGCYCPDCKEPIKPYATRCPHCGSTFISPVEMERIKEEARRLARRRAH